MTTETTTRTPLVEMRDIRVAFGGVHAVDGVTVDLFPGEVMALVGGNGAGKTTLLNMLIGNLPPDQGSVKLGSSLAVAALDQHRDSLDPGVTVAEALAAGRGDTVMVNGKPRHVVSYMKDFLFAAEQARTPLGRLSGGERGRLMLAQLLAKPSNLLVLDEPTNDFDMETLDVLEDMLSEYPGTVLLISHDRDFLDRLVSGVIVPEGGGRWTEYAGGYSDMLAQRGADLTRENRKSEPQKAARASAPATVESQPAKRRMSFKDKHALETLPNTIAALQAEADALQQQLADPKFYARDRAAFENATSALGKLQEQIASAEERWLELETEREALAGDGAAMESRD